MRGDEVICYIALRPLLGFGFLSKMGASLLGFKQRGDTTGPLWLLYCELWGVRVKVGRSFRRPLQYKWKWMKRLDSGSVGKV